MMCTVVTCWQELLHVGQCCYTWHCVVEFCASVLYVVMCSCMLCSVVTCYQESIHAALFHLAKNYYMLGNVVTRGIVLLNFVQQCYML